MSSNGPYFIDPELSQTSAPDAQMYALADGAMQAHQEQHQLAGLVQAATAAANHEVKDGTRGQNSGLGAPSLGKRAIRKRRQRQDDGNAKDFEEAHGSPQEESPSLSSASALFRRPSKLAKKYTRPPMSKLFTSLELSPENFLQLQSAAKNFMLDLAHQDRQETVGQRGKGDSELVKLRLWNCVREFLENQGVGQQYFGPDVPGDEGQQRTMIWPRDKNNIISAITPLLRRMVTNERQRQYAVESRKSGTPNSANITSSLIRQLNDGMVENHGQKQDSQKSLFELTTGSNPKEYVVGETYDWPMLQPHLVMVIQQIALPEEIMRQIVASISYHLRYTHREGFMTHRSACHGSCPDQFLDVMIRTGKLDQGVWEQPPNATLQKKRDNMKAILREVFNIIQAVISAGSQINSPTTALQDDRAGALAFPNSAGKTEEVGDDLDQSLTLQVSLVQNGQRIIPRQDVEAQMVPYLHSVVQTALLQIGPLDLGQAPKVKVLSPEGLVTVEDDEEWHRLLKLAKQTLWMDGEMKVILEFQ